MNFLHHLFSINKPTGFDKIEGYEDIKDIVIRALDSEENHNLLFIAHLQAPRHSSYSEY
jgi:hypothetical protein